MSDYGITGAGFLIKRLSDVKTSLENKFVARFGNINLDADTPQGQIIGIFSESIADVWEEMMKVYHAMYPASAIGFSLDNAVQFNGLTRNPASSSICPVLLIGDQGTVVAIGKQVEENVNNEIFETIEEMTIGVENVTRLDISIDTPVTIPHTYTITIESVSYSYASTGGDTETSIIAALVSEINSNQPESVTQVTATDNGDGTMRILSDDNQTNVSIVLDSLLNADEICSTAITVCQNTGVIPAIIGSIDTIVAPVSGWDSVENIVAATVGRDTESDVELRARRKISLSKLGNASIPAMKAKMADEIDGVTAVTINENDTEIDNTGSGGLPPHSIEFVVVGGLNSEIAELIWQIKAGGIQTHGNTSETITDSEGQEHVIKFTRPENVYGYINVVLYKVTDGTEVFPVDGVQAVIDAIEAYGQTYEIGEDILINRFYKAIFEIDGVRDADITIDKNDVWNPSYSPSYGSSDIAIDSDQIVIWDQDVSKQIIVSVS